MTDEVLATLDLCEVSESLPSWFAQKGNACYVAAGLAVPGLVAARLPTYPFSDGLIVLASRLDSLSLLLGGDAHRHASE